MIIPMLLLCFWGGTSNAQNLACRTMSVLIVPQDDLRTPSFLDCRSACENEPDCKFFTWNFITTGCGLRNYEFTSFLSTLNTLPPIKTGFPFSSAESNGAVPVGKVTRQDDVSGCVAACLTDVRCKSWSYYDNTDIENPEICVLNYYTNSVGISGPLSVTSGFKSCECGAEDNVLYVGDSLPVESQEACRQLCQDTDSCLFFTWNQEAKACGLRNYSANSAVEAPNQDTGFPYSDTILENTVLVQSVTRSNCSEECGTSCGESPECTSWTWVNSSPLNSYPNICIHNNYIPTRGVRIPGPTVLVSGSKACIGYSQPRPLGGSVVLISGAGRSSGTVDSYGGCDREIADIPVPSVGAAAAQLDGSVFTCGGQSSDYERRCFVLDVDGSWTEGPSMVDKRYYHTLNRVGDQLVAYGGWSDANIWLSSMEVLRSGTDSWEMKPFSITPARNLHCTVTVSSTDIIISGGGTGKGPIGLVSRVNVETGEVQDLSEMPEPLYASSCVLLGDKILLAGARIPTGYRATVLSLDISSSGSTWSVENSMNIPRAFSTGAVVNGNFVVYGGVGSSISSTTYETFNSNGTWITTALDSPRYRHAAAVLPCRASVP